MNERNNLSASCWISKGFCYYCKNFWMIVAASLLIKILYIPSILLNDLQFEKPISIAIAFFIITPVAFGFQYLTLNLVREERASLRDLFAPFRKYGTILLAELIFAFILFLCLTVLLLMPLMLYLAFVITFGVNEIGVAACIFLIVTPFILHVLVRIGYYSLFIVDEKEISATQSIHRSLQITKRNTGELFKIALFGLLISSPFFLETIIILFYPDCKTTLLPFVSYSNKLYGTLFTFPFLITIYSVAYDSLRKNERNIQDTTLAA